MNKEQIVKAIEELAEYDTVAGLFASISHASCITAIEALTIALDENRWIPCIEKMPDRDTDVFVWLTFKRKPYIGQWHGEFWTCDEIEGDIYCGPVAWRPMFENYIMEIE